MTKSVYIWGGLVLLALVVIFGFHSCSSEDDTREVMVDKGYTTKARRNRFLAAEKFLNKRDIDTETTPNFLASNLPESYENGILIASFQSLPLSGPTFESLVSWVNRGNTLICGNAEHARLNGASMSPECRSFFGLIKHTPLNESISDSKELQMEDVQGKTKSYSLEVELNHTMKPVRYADLFTDDANNCLGYRISQGQGTVICLNDFSIFSNESIASGDHAMLLEDLVLEAGYANPKVQLIYRSSLDESVWSWIWRNCKVFLLITILFITLFILRKGVRFGPPLPEPTPVRRQLLEHISACGKYSWDSKEGAHNLLTNLRVNVMEKLHRSHPMVGSLSNQEMTKELSEMTGVSTSRLNKALLPYQNELSEFTDIVITLQEVRKTL